MNYRFRVADFFIFYNASKAQEKSKVVSMHGQECEWGGFTVTAIVVFVVLFLIAKFGNF